MSWRNKWFLRCFLKVPKVWPFRSSCGKLFHTRGAATENQRLSNTVLQLATVSRSWVDEQSMRSGWYECSVSERYCCWFSIRDKKHNVNSLNWMLERTGNQCKWWSYCIEDVCWLPVPQTILAARFCTRCNLFRFSSLIPQNSEQIKEQAINLATSSETDACMCLRAWRW